MANVTGSQDFRSRELAAVEKKIREYQVAQMELESVKDNREVYQARGSGQVFFRTTLTDAKEHMQDCLKRANTEKASLLQPATVAER